MELINQLTQIIFIEQLSNKILQNDPLLLNWPSFSFAFSFITNPFAFELLLNNLDTVKKHVKDISILSLNPAILVEDNENYKMMFSEWMNSLKLNSITN